MNIEILLIRHGKTKGNIEKRYVGSTDEPLAPESEELLAGLHYREFDPDIVYSSSMKRCIRTAQLLFPGKEIITSDSLRETSFGKFEYKTHAELEDDMEYRRWIESAGAIQIPGAEDGMAFRKRCTDAFKQCIADACARGAKKAAFAIHGGTLMAVMEALAEPVGNYYSFMVNNAEGYRAQAQAENNSVKIINYSQVNGLLWKC